MTHDNVHIIHRRNGELVEERCGHNVWLDGGRTYLSSMLADPPVENRRISFMGVGIGSKHQALPAVVSSPPLSTTYPAGGDPHGTTGNEYDHLYPIAPNIYTLERPVRIAGGSTAYPGAPTDQWLLRPPPFQFDADIVDAGVIQFSGLIDTNLGDILYGPYVEMPISEIGLFLSDATSEGEPFNLGQMVAYHSFVTILLSPGSVVEIRWQVRF